MVRHAKRKILLKSLSPLRGKIAISNKQRFENVLVISFSFESCTPGRDLSWFPWLI